MMVRFVTVFKPRMEIASSILGSVNRHFWKRRSSALSFQNISGIHLTMVAPIALSNPLRASAGFKMLPHP